MNRIRNLISGTFGLILNLSLVMCLVLATVMVTGCGGDDQISKLKKTLNNTASTLNTVAKSNRALYDQRVISLETRIQVATVVHGANEYLITAINIARAINKDNFQGSKTQILQLLNASLTELRKVNIGKPAVDLAIQSAISLINTAVTIAGALTGRTLRYVLPYLDQLSAEQFIVNRELLKGDV